MSNRSVGNAFESRFARILFEQGFWVHLMKQSAAGQPADVIAVRHGRAYLIDCKVCESGVFKLSRIEQNQETAMGRWFDTGNGTGWFALEMPDKQVYMVSALDMNDYSIYRSILPESVIREHETVEQWERNRCV